MYPPIQIFIRYLGIKIFLSLDYARSTSTNQYRLHNPHYLLVFASFVFLQKDWVLTWKAIGQGQIIVAHGFFRLALFLKCLFITFNIFRQEIFAANLVVISKMVDPFLRKKPNFVQSFRDILFFTPIDIPIFVFSLMIVPEG